ncbi:MAG TPA: hypothetical protein VFW78_13365 [Bacteroidia bacterium]|nr:hypothetical protein [Bacteroidia bacterium]
MNRIPFPDIVFVAVATAIALLFTETGNADLLSRYVIVVVLISYFTGKYVRAFELKRNSNQ